MARPKNVTAYALNIAIINPRYQSKEHYQYLFSEFFKLRLQVSTQGDRKIIFGDLARELYEGRVTGHIDRVVEVNSEEWYNELNRKPATADERARIVIPPGMTANHREFRFLFDLEDHRLVFDNTDRNAKLMPQQVAKLFRRLADSEKIRKLFGTVNVTVEQKTSAVTDIINDPTLRQLSIVLKRDNGDQLGADFTSSLETQMAASKAQEATLSLKAQNGETLDVSQEIGKLATNSASTGEVSGQVVIDNHLTTRSSRDYPLEASETYDMKKENREHALKRAADRLIAMIKKSPF